MTTRKKHIDFIISSIKQTRSVSVDDLVELSKMNDFDTQHKYLQLKYGQHGDNNSK